MNYIFILRFQNKAVSVFQCTCWSSDGKICHWAQGKVDKSRHEMRRPKEVKLEWMVKTNMLTARREGRKLAVPHLTCWKKLSNVTMLPNAFKRHLTTKREIKSYNEELWLKKGNYWFRSHSQNLKLYRKSPEVRYMNLAGECMCANEDVLSFSEYEKCCQLPQSAYTIFSGSNQTRLGSECTEKVEQ